jgi:hypothetical protein
MKARVTIRSFPLTLTLSLQGRGEAIHPPSRAGGAILAYFYKSKLRYHPQKMREVFGKNFLYSLDLLFHYFRVCYGMQIQMLYPELIDI